MIIRVGFTWHDYAWHAQRWRSKAFQPLEHQGYVSPEDPGRAM
jgi:hypothetical protein